MPKPLHHSTLAAITRLAEKHCLPLVRADSDAVIVGDCKAVFCELDELSWWEIPYCSIRFDGPMKALRHALRKQL